MKEDLDNVKWMALLLTIMMTISGSKDAYRQGNTIMLLSINGPSLDESDTSTHIASWMSNSYGTGKRHKGHKANQSKSKDEKKKSIHKKKTKWLTLHKMLEYVFSLTYIFLYKVNLWFCDSVLI